MNAAVSANIVIILTLVMDNSTMNIKYSMELNTFFSLDMLILLFNRKVSVVIGFEVA